MQGVRGVGENIEIAQRR